jgi:tetratricopeptide (TPR) repeat protein
MFRFDDAESSLKKAEQIGTEIPWLDLNWADLLEKQGNLKEAANRYNKVIEKGTTNKKAYASALSGATSIYMLTGQYAKADQAYQRELAYEPDSAWSWGNYASFQLYLNEDVDGAIVNARKALSLMNYGMGRFILGSALYTKWAILKNKDENSTEADRYFKEARRIYPYLERVIEETAKYPYTMITANTLRKLKTDEY